MRAWIVSALVTGMVVAAPRADAEVRLVIADGYVSLEAKDATVRQILEEWARVGKTRIVNGERIAGTPVTLQFVHVPEREALDIVLRTVSGYLAAPRAAMLPDASQFDRILVMPTSTPPRVAAQSAPQPAFQPPPMPTEDVDMEEPSTMPMPVAGAPVQRGGAVFPPQYPNTAGFPVNPAQQRVPSPMPAFQQPPTQMIPPAEQPVQAQPSSAFGPPSAAPGVMPVGVSTPGMIVAPPTPQPGQPTPDNVQR